MANLALDIIYTPGGRERKGATQQTSSSEEGSFLEAPPPNTYTCKFVSVQWLDSVMCLPLPTRETGSCGLHPPSNMLS